MRLTQKDVDFILSGAQKLPIQIWYNLDQRDDFIHSYKLLKQTQLDVYNVFLARQYGIIVKNKSDQKLYKEK